jgi:hypothetical protein
LSLYCLFEFAELALYESSGFILPTLLLLQYGLSAWYGYGWWYVWIIIVGTSSTHFLLKPVTDYVYSTMLMDESWVDEFERIPLSILKTVLQH